MVADNSIGRTWSCFGTRLSSKLLYSGVRIVWLGAAILVASFELALSEQFSGTPAEACLAVNRYLSLGAQLPRTAARLKSGERLLIVAIGSSSTVGLWVLRSAAYPLPRRIAWVRVSIASPRVRPSPNDRRVGIRIRTFEMLWGRPRRDSTIVT
jgi:hypothetical protein